MLSPYKDKRINQWLKITKKLVRQHPLSINEIREVVLDSWKEIFRSQIGEKPYFIGKDIFPKPQIIGFLLHELIPLEFQRRYPEKWRKEKQARDKDIIYIPDDFFSIEIKTSSHPESIFGNRSYAQKTVSNKKQKSGYYLAINFEKFREGLNYPKILKIRFGWLDHEDWLGQKAPSGQQSRLNRDVESLKLLKVYPIE